MLAAKRQALKRLASTSNATPGGDTASKANSDGPSLHYRGGDHRNVAIFRLSIPLLAGPSAIMSVIVVTADFASIV